MNILKKLTDIIAPEEVYDDIFADGEEEAVVENAGRKVVGGSSVDAVSPVMPQKRPNLTLHTNNSSRTQDFKIKIYVPQHFDNVAEIADALKSKNAAIVNYERVELPEQQRICDFLNGVCYVQDGEVRRISNTMVLYVPTGVEINEAKPVNALL